MSSILRALKKAEQDGSVYRNNPELKLNVQRIFNATNWSRPRKFFFNNPNIALLSCIVLVSISLFFFILSIKKKPPSISTIHPKLTQEVQTIPVIPSKKVPPSINKQLLSKKTPVVSVLSPAPDPIVNQNIQQTIKQTIKKPEISIKKPPVLADVKPLSANNEPKVESNEFTHIEDGTLKIQAISWSKTPENRIAVINNNIVGENDRILDFKVIQIRKDVVILRKDDKNFSLKFRYH